MSKILFSVKDKESEVQSDFSGEIDRLKSILDGSYLEYISIQSCDLISAQDCDDLISFLTVHRYCFADSMNINEHTPNPKSLTAEALVSGSLDQAAALQKLNSDIQAVHEDKKIRLEVCKELIRSYTALNISTEMGVTHDASRICDFIITGKTKDAITDGN